jgi:hypothetical protein
MHCASEHPDLRPELVAGELMFLKIKTKAITVAAILSATASFSLVGTVAAAPITMQLTDELTSGGITAFGGATDFTALPAVGTYSSSFSAKQTATVPGSPAPGFGFYDDFEFTVPAATADAVSSTIDLGSLSVSGLQERLYKAPFGTPPMLGDSAGPWSATVPFTIPGVATGETTVLTPEMLTAGTYVLQIRGTATGQDGGGYTGQLDLQPVPLPAALPLLLSGLGLLGAAGKNTFCRRQRS